MFRKKFFWLSILSTPLVIAILFSACRRNRHDRVSSDSQAELAINMISRSLDLSSEQNAKLEEIRDKLVAEKPNFENMRRDIYDEIFEQTTNEKIDREKLNRLFEQKEAEWKETRKFLVDKYSAFHTMLTPEQREQMAALMKEHDGSRVRWH